MENSSMPSYSSEVQPAVSGLAISSLVCGILGVFTVGLTGIVGVVLGHVALSQIKKSGGTLTGRGFAIGALITGYLSLLLPFALGFAIYSLKGIASSAKIAQTKADFQSFDSALRMYKLTSGTYPTTEQGLQALVEKPTVDPVPERWMQIMKRTYSDAWGQAYLYQFPGRRNPEKPEITSKGPDGVVGTSDDLSRQDR